MHDRQIETNGTNMQIGGENCVLNRASLFFFLNITNYIQNNVCYEGKTFYLGQNYVECFFVYSLTVIINSIGDRLTALHGLQAPVSCWPIFALTRSSWTCWLRHCNAAVSQLSKVTAWSILDGLHFFLAFSPF